jgi:membrane-associated phospholipid phosphatase
MPSLHTAFATLIALFVITRLRTRWRFALLLYRLLMGLALVYLAEHYVVDLVAGVIYAVAVQVGVTPWQRVSAAAE